MVGYMENIDRGDLDIVYINLEKSTDRMAGMEKKLSQFFKPSDFKRFQAIQGDNRNAKISPNELGCFLSHLEVIQSSSVNHPTLILEDDVKFCKNFNTYLKTILTKLPEISLEWDILFFAQMTDLREVKKTAQLIKMRKKIPKGALHLLDAKPHYASSTCAYLINPLSKDKIIRLLKQNEMEGFALPIDTFIQIAIGDNSLKCKFVFPYLTGLERLDTTVHTTEKQIKYSRIAEDQLNLFYIDSNPPDLIKNSLDHSTIESNQDAYLASLILFNWLVLYS
jgi:GR25 family glycosyltransferase involved in LPS biosynthesis